LLVLFFLAFVAFTDASDPKDGCCKEGTSMKQAPETAPEKAVGNTDPTTFTPRQGLTSLSMPGTGAPGSSAPEQEKVDWYRRAVMGDPYHFHI
jgi:hypothetical protein